MASTYLTRNQTNGNQDKWTFSGWVKRSKLGAAQCIFATSNGSTTSFDAKFDSSDRIDVYNYLSGGYGARLVTNRVFRDTISWYHIVIVYDSGNSTEAQRLRIYVNGTEESSFSTTNYPSLNENSDLNVSGSTLDIGRQQNGSQFFDGLMSHLHLSDGYAYAPTVFGSTDSTTGEWKINTGPSVTYGNNGFFILKDGNSVTDQSGNSNNFTVSGGTLTKTEDCPSNNFATWNASLAMNSTMVLTNGATTGKTATNYAAGASNTWWSSLGMSSGKYYCEIKMSAATANQGEVLGVGYDLSKHQQGSTVNAYHLGYISEGWAYFGAEGKVKSNNSDVLTGLATWTTNDIIGIAIDMDNNKLYFSKNGTFVNSGDPTSGSTGTGAVSLTANKTYFFGCSDASMSNTNTFQANFGNGYFGTTAVSSAGTNASNLGIFEYNVPTGYTALCTKGLNE